MSDEKNEFDLDLGLEDDEVIPQGIDFKAVDEEVKQTLAEINIEVTEEDKQKYAPITAKKRGPKPKKLNPSDSELDQMTEEEIVSSAETSPDDDIKRLYYEFNSFLMDKSKIKEDTGVKVTIPTSIDLLDAILGGGFAVGTLSQIVGQSGGGKSMLAMQFLGSAQRKYNGGIMVGCLDSEESITTVRMANLGVRHPMIKPYTDLTIEKVFQYIQGMCLFKQMKDIVDMPSVVMWDSVANTQSQKERESDDPNSCIGHKGRMLSLMIPKYVSMLGQHNICMLAINQLRDQIQIGPTPQAKDLNFMQQGKNIPGGNALRYNSFHLLNLKVETSQTTKMEEKYGFAGIIAEVKAIKNKLFPPNIPIHLVGSFTTGFSNFWTNYVFMTENGYINAGAWNTLRDYPNLKFRTKDAETTYTTNPEFKETFDNVAKDAIQKEIIDKNTVVI